jgi:hypothetical protein
MIDLSNRLDQLELAKSLIAIVPLGFGSFEYEFK